MLMFHVFHLARNKFHTSVSPPRSHFLLSLLHFSLAPLSLYPISSVWAMASISVPCPKCPAVIRAGAARRESAASHCRVSLVKGRDEKRFTVLKAKALEATIESSSNSLPLATTKSEVQLLKDQDIKAADDSNVQAAVPESVISAFMSEVSNIVKLVDSRDIIELKLKQKDCELIIRKTAALQPPTPAAPLVTMQPPQAVYPTQPPVSHAIPASSSPPTSALAPAFAPAKATMPSLPPLKSPMAGIFYRSPAPGEPPFVKIGDKVKKGQVVCIIEAMKLMNEIEADQSGTVIEILVENKNAVSFDTPLLVIGP